MKFLVESENSARECDYASSPWLLCIPHTNTAPDVHANHIGWGDAFSGAIKCPCASAYKLSAKSDPTSILCGGEAEWINPPLCVRAVGLLLQPGLLGLLKLIYKASVYSGFTRQGKVNSNGPLDGNKSQHGYKAHTAFFPATFHGIQAQPPPPNNPNFMCTPTHSPIHALNQATQESAKLAFLLRLLLVLCPPHLRPSSRCFISSCMWE